jgi:hypothetical protein
MSLQLRIRFDSILVFIDILLDFLRLVYEITQTVYRRVKELIRGEGIEESGEEGSGGDLGSHDFATLQPGS